MKDNTDFLTEIVYPPNVERYNASKPPLKQSDLVTKTACFVSSILLSLLRKGYKIEKINMDNLKPPYILLINHMQSLDFCTMFKATYPHKVNTVATFHTYYTVSGIMEKLGCICTRKFTTDLSLVRACKKVLQEYGDIFCMYPEARYTPDGTLQVLPNAIGKLAKKNNVPVVVILNHGNYLNLPFWTNFKFRKTPIRVEMKQILTAQQVSELSVDEINKKIREEMYYNEYKWQKENDIHIKERYRAEGLNKVLYQCPNCKTEHKMISKGFHLWCEECDKKWEMTELGEMKALDGKTEFSHIPDWYEWERNNVRKQILDGTYQYEEELQVYSSPGVNEYIDLGKAKVTHDFENGFIITGNYNGHDYRIQRHAKTMYALHVEYEFKHLKLVDCFDISTSNDSFYCIPTQKDIVTKLCLATEEMYKIATEVKEKTAIK